MRAVLLGAALFFLTAAGAGEANSAVDIMSLLREFGFPTFVATWFMWRIEKRLDRFTEAIEKLITIVTVMATTVDNLPAGPPGPAGPAGPPGPPGPQGPVAPSTTSTGSVPQPERR